jgi:hypothetical protein
MDPQPSLLHTTQSLSASSIIDWLSKYTITPTKRPGDSRIEAIWAVGFLRASLADRQTDSTGTS